jgi:hypothetical protein
MGNLITGVVIMSLTDFKWALITGASSGIGKEFAVQLSKKGLNIIAIGRNEERLIQTVETVKKSSNVEIISYTADLSQQENVKSLVVDLSKYQVDLLINNAGFGLYGEFTKLELSEIEKMIEVNIKALTSLSHIFSKEMIARKFGGIINIASVAGHIPLPYFSAYAATKAYVYNFSLGLWAELRKYNVHVLCVSPGPTETRFFERAFKNQSLQKFGSRMKPDEVVAGTLKAFEKGSVVYTPGMKNKFITFIGKKLLPDRFIAMVAGG